jgi:hypothetical protein
LAAVLLVCLVGHPQERPEVFNDSYRDLAKLDPKHCKVQIRNDRLRVLRVRLGPEEALPLYDDRSNIVVAITEVHVRLISPTKKVFDVHMEKGDTRSGYAEAHSMKNLTNSLVDLLLIEIEK